MVNINRIMMTIEYDGSNYHGFQRQDNANTVQAAVEKAIHRLSGEVISILGASRTDAGVHARGQVIAFDTASAIPVTRWQRALNTYLPPDIRITACQLAAPDFHPQFMAVKKRYAYYIYRRREGAVFYRRYALCNSEPLDIEAMQRACRHIAGQHDFRAFCASGSSVKSYVRNVTACRLNESENTLRLDIEANGFLYNMVRIIMGTLLEVGRKRLQAEQVKEIIASRDRCLAGPTVVPHGLYLLKVSYPFSEEE